MADFCLISCNNLYKYNIVILCVHEADALVFNGWNVRFLRFLSVEV